MKYLTLVSNTSEMRYEGNLVLILGIILRITCGSEAVYPDGECFEMWGPNEEFVCRGPRRRDKIACVEFLEDKQNYGFLTPTNETIIFDTPNFAREKGLKVYNGSNFTIVSYESSESGLALITPDKYKIWIRRNKCQDFISKKKLEFDEKFVANFTFDYEERNCYKIYKTDEVISPYTCDDLEIFETCFKELDNCTVITTQNGENVTLGCSNETYVRNCVKVSYKGTTSEMCLEKLEERCVGFTTPSGLRILVTCRLCFRNGAISYSYDSHQRKQIHEYVKTYIRDEYQGKHSYTQQKLGVLKKQQRLHGSYKSSVTLYACFAKKYNCYLLPLDSNEIVHMDCQNHSTKRSGCYTVVDSHTKAESLSCAQIINEVCIGIITPKNQTVALQCYDDWLRSRQIGWYLDSQLKGYRTGLYLFPRNYYVDMFQMRYKDNRCESVHVRTLDRPVVTTPAQERVVVVHNDGNGNNGCYSFEFASKDNGSNVTLCVQLVTDLCIGVITPSGWSLIFSCYPEPEVAHDGDERIGVDIRFTFQVKGWEPIFKY